MRPLFVLAITILAGVGVIAQQAPTFKSGTRIVPVIATVTDAQGRLVPNLEQQDFSIFDNGSPRRSPSSRTRCGRSPRW
jgi:hypothetical protein